MLLNWFNKDLDASDLDLAKRDGQRSALLAADSPSTSIGDIPVIVKRAEIAADCDVSIQEFEPDPGRF